MAELRKIFFLSPAILQKKIHLHIREYSIPTTQFFVVPNERRRGAMARWPLDTALAKTQRDISAKKIVEACFRVT